MSNHMSFDERVMIQEGLDLGKSLAEIGRQLGRSRSTISRRESSSADSSTVIPGIQTRNPGAKGTMSSSDMLSRKAVLWMDSHRRTSRK